MSEADVMRSVTVWLPAAVVDAVDAAAAEDSRSRSVMVTRLLRRALAELEPAVDVGAPVAS